MVLLVIFSRLGLRFIGGLGRYVLVRRFSLSAECVLPSMPATNHYILKFLALWLRIHAQNIAPFSHPCFTKEFQNVVINR